LLIVNADDFGLGPGINAGIARAVSTGILTSVSVMANGAALEEAVALARQWPQISVGTHLALVGGRPVSPPESVPSLVDGEGRLPAGYRELLRRLLTGGIRAEDVYREWSAQVALLRRCDLRLTHLDSHQHLHLLPRLLPVALRVAQEAGIRAMRLPLEAIHEQPTMNHEPRRRGIEGLLLRAAARRARPRLRRAGIWSPDHFAGFADSGRMTTATLAAHLERLRPGVTELMTHPGCDDPTARPSFPTPYLWEAEVAALTDPGIRRRLEELRIALVPYRPLPRSQDL
jgi:hopanoid biosynthesis associated protein HpnK